MKHSFFQWGDLSVRQRKVLSWWTDGSKYADYDGIIADGAIRSGKTVSMGFSFVLWAMTRFDRHNFAMCGKTIASFRRNVLGTLKQQLKARGYTVTERRSDNLLVISKGDRANLFYIFGGKDEASQDLIQGITLAGVFFDEVALMPESFVNQATARCSVKGSKFWFNCNPAGPQHWFYTGWICKCRKRRLLYLHFTMDDNLTLAPEIKARYRSQWVGVFYDRYIRGLWVAAEGLIYSFFDARKHVTDKIPKSGRYYISCDYGTLNPFSAGLWCVKGGRAVRIAEYYYSGRSSQDQLTDEEYYTQLEKLAGNRMIEAVIVDPSAASFIATIRRHGRFSVRKAKNDVLYGIRLVSVMLKAGVIQIGASCKDAIREFGLYSWQDKGEVDKPIKENDHAMDDIRYFCATVMRKDREARALLGGMIEYEED
ncbi:MAG: PBSX family phage terminase large subunit [Oscillospiraceae bacterium]|nr:PBSX family phage terminase large subunit [Oscillospiraceae bacterium]